MKLQEKCPTCGGHLYTVTTLKDAYCPACHDRKTDAEVKSKLAAEAGPEQIDLFGGKR